jgi:hypothetical protein
MLTTAAGFLLFPPRACTAESEMTFDVLEVGTRTYTNVTVTTRSKDYVFLVHKDGMVSIKKSELSQEALEKLGYIPKPRTNTVTAALAKATLEKIDNPQVQQLQQKLAINPATGLPKLPPINPWMVGAVLGGVFLVYLFFCYCAMLICQKAGHPPGALVWIPILQLIPLYRAAGMSAAWVLACLVPVLNIVAQVLWCVKIVKARGKSVWVTILLILPMTNLFAFLYLAFSSAAAAGKEKEKVERRPQLMTLEAA